MLRVLVIASSDVHVRVDARGHFEPLAVLLAAVYERVTTEERMILATDPFKTAKPIGPAGRKTFDTIEARLARLNPPVVIRDHVALSRKAGETQFSSLVAGDGVLDGISFLAVDPAALERAFDIAQDKSGKKALASMKEDPGHWALKMSFGKTIGTGWREIWRPEPFRSPSVLAIIGSDMQTRSARFGSPKTSVNFTALHCAVDKVNNGCNVHIDSTGFVLELPTGGVALTANVYDHFMNELLLKTEFRDWLVGSISNQKAAYIVGEAIRRLSIVFPNASNEFAGLERTVNNIRRPSTPFELALTAGKLLRPIGITVDLYESDHFKLQVAGTIVDGDRSVTINISGER